MSRKVRLAESQTDVEQLAQEILGERTRPLVLISTNASTGLLDIDATDVFEQVGDVADVWTIPTGDPSHALSSLIPAGTEAYRGAGRSYPIGFGANPRPERSPLRFPGKRALNNLVNDALAHAYAAGLFKAPAARSVRAEATVVGLLAAGSRALVDVRGHGTATIWHELTYPDFPLEWVLATGQLVEGTLDLDSHRMTVVQVSASHQSLAQHLPHLCVTSALVSAVTPTSATLLLHPDVAIAICQQDVSPNPLDTLDLLLTEGDVVSARVVHLQGERMHVRLTDVDDDEPVLPAVSLLDGGQPWLLPGRVLMDQRAELFEEEEAEPPAAVPVPLRETPPSAEIDAPAAERPLPGPGPRHPVTVPQATAPSTPTSPIPLTASKALQSAQLELHQARARIQVLEDRLREAGADDSRLRRLEEAARGSDAHRREARRELGQALHEIEGLKDESRRTKRALLDARNQKPLAARTDDTRDARIARWASREDWIGHELYVAWVDRVAPAERSEWPLGDYTIGADFASSLAALDEGQFDKCVRTVLDVVTGRARNNGSRRVHPLRTGDGAEDRDVVRADGARCFRASIENGTPAARRLHYWQLADGRVELSRVVTHDVMVP